MSTRKYWIAVVSKEHAMRWVHGWFMQVCHGKKWPLSRMKEGDILIVYSPKLTMDGTEKYQKFVAIWSIPDENIYEYEMTPSFIPFRRNVVFHDSQEVSILPLLENLSFIKDPKHWWYPFRFGILEIPEVDFLLISSKMWYYE